MYKEIGNAQSILTNVWNLDNYVVQANSDFTVFIYFIYFKVFISSVRSSSVYHGLLEGSHFFRFFKFFRFESENESERTQHVLYFWKAWDSRISNMTFPCIKSKSYNWPVLLLVFQNVWPWNKYLWKSHGSAIS